MSSASLTVAVVFGLFQIWELHRWEREPVGDEAELLEWAETGRNPLGWIRVPVMYLLTRLSKRFGGPGHDLWPARLMASTATVLTVALTLEAAERIAGLAGILIATALLAVPVERLILGCHWWPDPLLGLTLAAVTLELTDSSPSPLLVGLLAMTAFLIRFEYLFLAPFCATTFLLPTSSPPPGSSLEEAGWCLAPTALLFLFLSLRNGRRHGVFLPDTTIAFNLLLARLQTDLPESASWGTESKVQEALRRWNPKSQTRMPAIAAALGQVLLGRPLRHLHGVAGRIRAFCGPDSFVSDRLLREEVYPGRHAGWIERVSLRIGFPIVVATSIVATSIVATAVFAAGSPEPLVPIWALPSLLMLIPTVAFHFRTRYRLPFLVVLSLLTSRVVAVPEARTLLATHPVGIAVAVAGIVLLLIRLPIARDR